MNELWKDIPGYNGLYQASNLGNIRNSDLKLIPGYKNGKERNTNNYYLAIGLNINGIRIVSKVHRLILKTFKGDSNLQVDHINNIKYDNRLENLRYCTNQENCIFRSGNNLKKTCNYIGVTINKKTGKHQSRIRINGIRKSLGYFYTEEEAYEAYLKELKKYNN